MNRVQIRESGQDTKQAAFEQIEEHVYAEAMQSKKQTKKNMSTLV